jgi:hypothetical protein
MSGSRRGHALLLVAVLAAGAACDGGGDAPDDDTTSEEDTGATDDGSGNRSSEDSGSEGEGDDGESEEDGGPEAVVSPLRIPSITQEGAPIGDVRGSIADDIAAACGGELCVDLAEAAESGATVTDDCTFSRTDPPEGTEVDRGSTVTLVVSCEETETGETEEDETATTGPPGATTLGARRAGSLPEKVFSG